MPKRVRLPDGQIGVFGDDESNEQIRAKITQKYPNAYPDPGVLAGAGRFVRGAGRAVAGGLADAYSLSDVPGIGALGPGTALRLSQKIPGGTEFRHKVEDFANAPTPTAAETAGWWGVQGLEALAVPEKILPLGAAVRGLKAGGRYAWGKLAPKLGDLAKETARQTATQTGKEVGEKAAEQAVKKPRLRIKASGDVKEITPEGEERTVRQWTKRRMEKLGQRAKGEPTSSTAPPTDADVQADYQKVIEALGQHGAHRLGRHLLHHAGVPPGVSHMLMTHMGRRLGDLAITTGALGGARTISGEAQSERRKGTPEIPPSATPQAGQTPP